MKDRRPRIRVPDHHTLRRLQRRLAWRPLPRAPQRAVFTDLWARSNAAERRLEFALLAVNFIGYIFLNAQFYYVHQAVYFDFSWASYLATVPRTLLDLLLKPVSVTQVPMMIPVLGSLMAGMIIVPLLVAQFYRWWAALPFLLVLLVVGHLPVMALYLLAACVVVGLPRLRMPFAYANTLIGIFILTIYVLIATRNPGDIVVQLSRPTDIFLLYAPWIFALLVAAAVSGVVMILAKLLAHRPGLVSGMLILPLVLPTVLFAKFIGRDELQYRLLEGQYGPNAVSGFVPRDLARDSHLAPDELEAQALTSLVNAQQALLQAGEAFLRDHPDSRHVPSIRFLVARALDLSLDLPTLRATGEVVLYDDFPSPASKAWWQSLVDRHGQTVFGLLARQRLAVLLAREGQLDAAQGLLREALDLYRRGVIAPPPLPLRNTLAGLLKADPPTELLNLDLHSEADEIADLLVLLEQNDDPRATATRTALLAEWFRLDWHQADYPRQLERLRARFPGSALDDNISLALAMRLPAEQRGARLAQLAANADHTDGGRQALLLLGEWYHHRAEARGSRAMYEQARVAYDRIVTRWPASTQAEQARTLRDRLLARLRTPGAAPPQASAPSGASGV